MRNIITIIILLFNVALCQTALSGLYGFYSAQSVALSGTSGIAQGLDSGQINPANLFNADPQIRMSIIKYPANIYAQSANYSNNLKDVKYGVSLRRINYGTFDAISIVGESDGHYTAGDTWLSANFAKSKKALAYGASMGLFLSNLESYNASALLFAAGTVYNIDKYNLNLGLAVTNVGLYLNQFTNYKDTIPLRLTISAGKKLKYLPLHLNTNLSYKPGNKKTFVRLGGIFQLPYNFNLMFGINSDNLDQTTEYKNIKSLLGGAGIGLSYTGPQYEIAFGGYSYGTGGWTYGTTFCYRINKINN